MKYAIYNEWGEIQRIVVCEKPEEQLQDGENFVEGYADDELFVVVDGSFVQREPRPGRHYIWRGEWIDPRTNEEKTESLVKEVRSKRNRLLASSDWTQLPDVPLETNSAWATYRQELRDITGQPGFPNVQWPEPPESS